MRRFRLTTVTADACKVNGMKEIRPNSMPEAADLLAMYRRMLLIRKAEEQLLKDVRLGRTPGQVHTSDGQEAIAVGLCAHLEDADQITSTHRGHGHFLAKGGDVRTMFAEIYGKKEGVCGGMGGSMHVADFSKGIVGANGIVGAGLAIAAGAAFANQLDRKGNVSLCFFGDGAANQGTLMECLNIASLWRLPVIFVCENNGYSEFSPTETVTAGGIADRAKPFGIPTWTIDGNDLTEVWRTGAKATAHAREGEGPAFIEARTYRYSGHFSAEANVLATSYRSDREIEAWRDRDPISRVRSYLEMSDEYGSTALAQVETEIDSEIADSVAFGLAGTPPEPGTAEPLMFAEGSG